MHHMHRYESIVGAFRVGDGAAGMAGSLLPAVYHDATARAQICRQHMLRVPCSCQRQLYVIIRAGDDLWHWIGLDLLMHWMV
jgi:hypothetical protein